MSARCIGDKLLPKWWRDEKQLRHEVKVHGGPTPAARAHNVAPNTVQKGWHEIIGEPLPRGPVPAPVASGAGSDDDWLLAAIKKLGDHATVEQLADHCDVAPRRVHDAVERLGLKGYRVEEDDHRVVLHRVVPPSVTVHRALFKGKDIAFGVISDTHLASKHECLEELHMAYKLLEDEGITTVYHPGDLVCGIGIFPGQVNEIKHHTYEDQVAYAVENYPRSKTITTHIISGNHDIEGVFGKIGANPVVAFCNQRDDFEFAGDYSATFELEQGTRIDLLHPKGGVSYAASYKLQKFAEAFEIGSKPNLMLVGHYHRRLAFEARGIQMLLCGCFESGGSFGKRLGMTEPAVGFHIVRMRVADDGSIVRFNPEWLRFYPGRKVERKQAA